ncbi:acyl-homoserine-lactone synthase [Novosphingobium sp. M1R2S20]|uniref:Acyl-homoserine-lactone synthase n=1 Tax=Novosphingobium rhizovicinum TaxID=3228928 RepID=A0ABV3RFR8_9SPHN
MLHTLRCVNPTREHPAPPEGVLRGMFEARKAVFVDLLKWDVPVLAGRYEVDQFDDIHATYLVVTDAHARHLASARLLPTTRAHILDSFYSELCDEPPPRQADVLEVTRFCLDRRLRAAERRTARDALVHHLVAFALAHDIVALSAIAELTWFQQILAFGWRCRPLGLPRNLDGQFLAAMRIEIEQDTPARLIAAGLSEAGVDAPAHRAAA